MGPLDLVEPTEEEENQVIKVSRQGDNTKKPSGWGQGMAPLLATDYARIQQRTRHLGTQLPSRRKGGKHQRGDSKSFQAPNKGGISK